MPFNVCDKNGKYVGFIFDSYPQYTNVFRVAVTSNKIDNSQINFNELKDKLAEVYRCKNILGKINIEKFQSIINDLAEENNIKYKNMDSNDFIKILSLKNLKGINKFINYDKNDIKGFILADIDKLDFDNGTAFMNETVDYIPSNKPSEKLPVYSKIIDYPVINTDIMGIRKGLLLGADFADYGGRNHTHTTILNIISENFKTQIEISAPIYAKKDMKLNLYMDGSHIKGVFCDGIIYKF